ncbi:DEAD DEAH box helicase, partial [Coemansia sp. RSA 2618]
MLGVLHRVFYRQRRWSHTLRPYQQECIDSCLGALTDGVWRQAVSLPVGSGKTVVFSNLIQRVQAPTALATKTLVLAHREELLEQAARQIRLASPQLEVVIDQGKRMANPAADVVVASVPTLGRENSARLTRYDPRRFKCIIIDEAHHAAAETYGRILDYFRPEGDAAHSVLVWGCSATLQRHDGLGLSQVFDKIVYQKRFIEMIREGWLTQMRVLTVRTATRLDGVRSYAGEFAASALSAKVNSTERNLAVVQAYRSLAADRRSVLVFAVDVAHARALEHAFVKYGVNAKCVLGTTNTAERENIISEFRAGQIPVVVNCGILTEGTDIPNIDCVIMARPTRSPVLFQQMLGRGMRLHTGKTDCLVVDFVDTFRRDAAQITVPTLLGLDPQLVLNSDNVLDEDLLRKKDKQQRLERDGQDEKTAQEEEFLSTVRDFEESLDEQLPETLDSLKGLGFRVHVHLNPLRFFELDKKPAGMPDSEYRNKLASVSCGDVRLRSMSHNAWVCLSSTRYLCSINSTLYFITSDESGEWRGSKRLLQQFKAQGSMRVYYTPEQNINLTASTLAHAIKGTDRLISRSVDRYALKNMGWNAGWRSLPPTSKQLNMLAKRGVSVPEEITDSNNKRLTRGCATNLILRLTHGSSKSWK